MTILGPPAFLGHFGVPGEPKIGKNPSRPGERGFLFKFYLEMTIFGPPALLCHFGVPGEPKIGKNPARSGKRGFSFKF